MYKQPQQKKSVKPRLFVITSIIAVALTIGAIITSPIFNNGLKDDENQNEVSSPAGNISEEDNFGIFDELSKLDQIKSFLVIESYNFFRFEMENESTIDDGFYWFMDRSEDVMDVFAFIKEQSYIYIQRLITCNMDFVLGFGFENKNIQVYENGMYELIALSQW